MVSPFAHLAIFLVEVLHEPRSGFEILAIRVDRGEKPRSGAGQKKQLLRPELHAIAFELAVEERVHHAVLVAEMGKLFRDDAPQLVDEAVRVRHPHVTLLTDESRLTDGY